MEKVCTLIVAGYAPIRAGLAALLREEEGICLQGEAPDGAAYLARLLPGLQPDAILLDTTSGGSASLTRVLETLTSQDLPPALVVLGDSPTDELPRLLSARTLPGWGYLLRSAEGRQIAAALQAAHVGAIVLDRTLRVTAPAATHPAGEDPLTPREMEVLRLMAQGLPNKLIAARLGVSLHTAKFHVAQILGKLGAESRTEAVTRGARQGLVPL